MCLLLLLRIARGAGGAGLSARGAQGARAMAPGENARIMAIYWRDAGEILLNISMQYLTNTSPVSHQCLASIEPVSSQYRQYLASISPVSRQ